MVSDGPTITKKKVEEIPELSLAASTLGFQNL